MKQTVSDGRIGVRAVAHGRDRSRSARRGVEEPDKERSVYRRDEDVTDIDDVGSCGERENDQRNSEERRQRATHPTTVSLVSSRSVEETGVLH